LKRAGRVFSVWGVSTFPRSKERGPVEASEFTASSPSRSIIFPRSKERGPVEALCSPGR